MNRLSFRPRPLDIHKKIPIIKSIKEFEDDDAPLATSTRSSQLQRIATEADNEVHKIPIKKAACDIPIPQFVVVDTYEGDYACTFKQPTSYVRGRGARAELGKFVEYDLDNEDEDWLKEFNKERKFLPHEKFERLLFKLEILDHKTRERAGIIASTFGSPVPVLLQLDAAAEALQSPSMRYVVFQSVYNYWKKKRERWEKPILRNLQPSPPINDTNPYNVFRPREKAHRLHMRRRRENSVFSFEKLRQVRRNLEQVKAVLDTLIKREEKKREFIQSEASLQRIQMKYKHQNLVDYKLTIVPNGRTKQDLKQQLLTNGWNQERDPHEPVLLFTKPLDQEKLAAASIVPPSNLIENGSVVPPYNVYGRIGRGGRIIFDRRKNPWHG